MRGLGFESIFDNTNLGSVGRFSEISAYEGVFLASYGVWLIAMVLSSTFFAAATGLTVLMALRYFGIGGAVLSLILRGEHRASEVAGLSVLIVLTFIANSSNAPALLDLIVFVYCGRSVKFGKIARESLWVSGFILLFTVLSAKAGFIENYVSISSGGGAVRRREYLGFLYALQPSQLMFNITCLVVFVKGEKFSIPCALALLAANLFIFEATNGRLSFIISATLITAAFLFRHGLAKKTLGRLLVAFAPLAFLACFALSWFATVRYSTHSPVLYELNTILGNRLDLGHRALAEYGTTLFGQEIGFIGNGLGIDGKLNRSGAYNYVDCLYVRLPLLYGWVFTILFLAGITLVTVLAVKRRNYALVLVLVAIAAHCVVDDLAIRLQFSTFLFLISASLVEVVGGFLVRSRYRVRRRFVN